MARLRHDPSAGRSYELLSGGFVWSDEHDEALREACRAADRERAMVFRHLFAHRASLIRGELAARFGDLWDAVVAHHPTWPGFRPERRSPSLRAELEAEASAAIEEFERVADRCERLSRRRP